jgi:hypothetical protein
MISRSSKRAKKLNSRTKFKTKLMRSLFRHSLRKQKKKLLKGRRPCRGLFLGKKLRKKYETD